MQLKLKTVARTSLLIMLGVLGAQLTIPAYAKEIDEPKVVKEESVLSKEDLNQQLELDNQVQQHRQELMVIKRQQEVQLQEHGLYEGQTLKVEATAYTPYCKGCSGITKTGVDVRKTFSNIIAVDPTIIPLHTTVELKFQGESLGVFSCQDIGGDIKGSRIDVLHKTKEEAKLFGRKEVEVVIVALPK